MIDAWINEGSGWIVESIESQYIKVSIYQRLSGSSNIKIPVELKSLKKGLINIKNKYQKCFLWCHVGHINPLNEHPERITKKVKKLVKHITNPEEITQEDKESISDFDYDEIEFPV